ncbi:hypothetical protein VTJ04DRAFT_8420 [Mycothermus thermophilus]|uniref:uncharacterized protein n=1 Tax=Humicola insolens TaxID=85995 RepID=UPI0037441745
MKHCTAKRQNDADNPSRKTNESMRMAERQGGGIKSGSGFHSRSVISLYRSRPSMWECRPRPGGLPTRFPCVGLLFSWWNRVEGRLGLPFMS